jgi:hypothetical protein
VGKFQRNLNEIWRRKTKMFEKEISEVEKELKYLWDEKRNINRKFEWNDVLKRIDICQAKLSTLKFAQAKFDKFVDNEIKKDKDILYELSRVEALIEHQFPESDFPLDTAKILVRERIDELSSKQEILKESNNNLCEYCENCVGCYNCKNLVNGFRCINVKLSKKDKNRYWIFNKEVTREEWDKRYEMEYKEEKKVCDKVDKDLSEETL